MHPKQRGRPPVSRIPKPCELPGFEDIIQIYRTDRSPNWYGQFRTRLDTGYSEWQPKNGVSLHTPSEVKANLAALRLFGGHEQGIKVTRTYTTSDCDDDHKIKVLAANVIARNDAAAAKQPILAKRKTFDTRSLRVRDIAKRFGDYPIQQFVNGEAIEAELERWIKEEYTVVNLRNRDERKSPSRSTVNDLDCALADIYDEAARQGIVPRGRGSKRPSGVARIKEEWGTDAIQRAFIDQKIAEAIARVLKQKAWNEPKLHAARTYFAVAAMAGVRPGLEVLRIRPIDVIDDADGIHIEIRDYQAKHIKGYQAFVYEKGGIFPLREWLSQYIKHRVNVEGAKLTDELWPNHLTETYGRLFKKVLQEAGYTHDPKTGEPIVPYSLRHYHITRLIETTDWPIRQIALNCGTSEKVITKNYDRSLALRNKRKFTGLADVKLLAIGQNRMPVRTPLRIRHR